MKPSPPVIITAAIAVELAISRLTAWSDSGRDGRRMVGLRNEDRRSSCRPRPSTTSFTHSRSTSMPVQNDPLEVEELRAAVRPVIVVHRHFDDAKPASWIFRIISRQMTPVSLLELDASKISRRIRRKSQSTSRDAQPEQQLHGVVIHAPDDDAVERIGAADLVAVHHVGVGRQAGSSSDRELGRVVLRVARPV